MPPEIGVIKHGISSKAKFHEKKKKSPRTSPSSETRRSDLRPKFSTSRRTISVFFPPLLLGKNRLPDVIAYFLTKQYILSLWETLSNYSAISNGSQENLLGQFGSFCFVHSLSFSWWLRSQSNMYDDTRKRLPMAIKTTTISWECFPLETQLGI